MENTNTKFIRSKWEIPFQIGIHLTVFIFFSFDSDNPLITDYQVAFFCNYAFAVFIINYVFFPRFLFTKKYMAFFVSFLVLIAITIAIEELVIEKIYFPDTRGKRFRGVFYGLLDVLPIIFILSSFKYAWDTIQKMGQLEDMKVSLVENELKFLKSQVNPHFLFNNLNNLYAYALENSPKTPQIILELSAVLRYMLYDCQEKYVPLNNEIKHLQDFTKLNELQIEERGEIELDVKSNIDPDYQLAPLILIVFIENAFKHSTSSQDKEINISIAVELNEEGILHFTCSNSYVELSNHEMLKGGIGLDNVRKRLAYLYPDTHDLEIKEREGVFSVDLKLKLEKKV